MQCLQARCKAQDVKDLILSVLPVSAGEAVAARIDGWGTNKDEYRAGDAVTGFVRIRNEGSVPISDIDIEVRVVKETLLGGIEVHRKTYRASDFIQDFCIPPGEILMFHFPPVGQPPFIVPATSLARGKYHFTGRLTIGGTEIGRVEKKIQIIR